MKRDATHSACNSAATSPAASDPLAGELAVSRAAIARELDEIRTRLRKSADPHDLVGRHPWLAIAAVSACGFVAATTVVPARSHLVAQPVRPSRKASTASPWWAALVSRLLDVLKLVIERLLPTIQSGMSTRETAERVVNRDGTPGSGPGDRSA